MPWERGCLAQMRQEGQMGVRPRRGEGSMGCSASNLRPNRATRPGMESHQGFESAAAPRVRPTRSYPTHPTSLPTWAFSRTS